MITRAQALALTYRAELHFGQCHVTIGPRGGTTSKTEVWRVNGKCQTWKTRPDEFSMPIKYGFRGPHGYLTPANAADFHLSADCEPKIHDQSQKQGLPVDLLGAFAKTP